MSLKLYMFSTCPFCKKVLREIEASGRNDVELCNIHESEEHRNTLISVGGKEQVPCLFVDGKPMYESDDIVAWLKAHPQG